MLDSETKRRIDTCRDILVGKVPDPKSQVEQITIALIYKFMNDMDIEAEELGGERKYFKGEFDKYTWAKLVASGMGGHEVLALYGEAITKMSENTSIPELFRDIFKNAYLPYRDPETLRSFLKEIDTFKYDHSEKLGDAFEYLLSVLGSQGDAGQFRTPRHIIDFMVEVVNPQKGEVILDPACGTAGFLISAYKHILKHNSSDFKAAQDREAYDEKGVPSESVILESPMRYKGDLLTPDERKKLAVDVKGYDISPDMVRLSLVNMYLHGFPEPDIIEYDTLTSEEKWNDYADVILANPPFMTPKGGIRPHKRFSISASRSEVLFVDYIAEHLTPQGRAAIVVPEGIIFQSGGAYKQLRETLVKNSLIAVISLPAGVFNPYSGVKTSILVLDKRLAKKADNILFVKIENDGFGLGAQRRPDKKNDLPSAVRGIKHFVTCLQNGEPLAIETFKNFSFVAKQEIEDSQDFNLSGDRYNLGVSAVSSFPIVELGEIANIYQPQTITSKEILESGPYKVFGANGVIGYYDKFNHEAPEVLMTCRGATCGTINMSEPNSWVTGNAMVIQPKNNGVLKSYLFYLLRSLNMSSVITGAAQPQITRQSLAPFKIPLPPIEVQREIVAEIEGYQKIIDGAKQIVAAYQPRIPLNPDWPVLSIEDIADINPESIDPEELGDEIEYIDISSVENGSGDFLGVTPMPSKDAPSRARRKIIDGDVLISTVRPNLKAFTIIKNVSKKMIASTGFAVLRSKEGKILPAFLLETLRSENAVSQMISMMGKGAYPSINQKDVASIKITVPDPDTQKAIVEEIEKEQALVNGNKELIRLFEAKIQAAINRVWGEAE